MSTVIPFSQSLRERTRQDHGESEGAGFMHDLMSGAGSRDDYVALVAQHYFIYAALEEVAGRMREEPSVVPFLSDKLTRLPALEDDLEFLLGDDWRALIAPLPTTERYVARIREVGAVWPGGFVAHHYTRYLGDLSGGQHICRVMQKRYGFETNGVGFYLFDEIAEPAAFKDVYRAELDAAAWDEAERERVIEEVVLAYRFNTELFDDLAAAKRTAAA